MQIYSYMYSYRRTGRRNASAILNNPSRRKMLSLKSRLLLCLAVLLIHQQGIADAFVSPSTCSIITFSGRRCPYEQITRWHASSSSDDGEEDVASTSDSQENQEGMPFFARVQDADTDNKAASSAVPRTPRAPKTPPPTKKNGSTMQLVQKAVNETIASAENEIQKQISSVESSVEGTRRQVQDNIDSTKAEVERRRQEVVQTVDDIKAIPSRVQQNIDATKVEAERRRQEVERTVEDIKAIPSKVRTSVDRTAKEIDRTAKEIDRTAKEIQALPGKAKESYFETRDKAYEVYDELVEVPSKVERSIKETKQKVDSTVATIKAIPGNVKKGIDTVTDTANAFKDFASGLASGKPKNLGPKPKPEIKAPAGPGKATKASGASKKQDVDIDINDEISEILKQAEEAIQGADDVLSESITKK